MPLHTTKKEINTNQEEPQRVIKTNKLIHIHKISEDISFRNMPTGNRTAVKTREE